jgi:hypothetical protein
MEADRMKVWRACVLYDAEKPDGWVEVEAETYSELLEKLKGCCKPFRVIIYRRVG